MIEKSCALLTQPPGSVGSERELEGSIGIHIVLRVGKGIETRAAQGEVAGQEAVAGSKWQVWERRACTPHLRPPSCLPAPSHTVSSTKRYV